MRKLLLVCSLLLVACRPTANTPVESPATPQQQGTQVAPAERAATQNHQDHDVHAVLQGTPVVVTVPGGWEALTLESGIVFVDGGSAASIESAEHLAGMSVHLFLRDTTTINADVDNAAHHFLNTVVANPAHVGDALVMPPRPFTWDGYDAAYYTLNNHRGVVTLLVTVHMPPRTLAVVNASAPVTHQTEIRAELPQMLQAAHIGTHTVHGTSLDSALPNPLPFPQVERDDVTVSTRRAD